MKRRGTFEEERGAVENKNNHNDDVIEVGMEKDRKYLLLDYQWKE